jgi:alkanesulfonate monooxygenase SsuD/methylene tetrahydromethanopterin reductase-like flavin-dependent oxidoreductase (luciferase family)
MKVGACLPIGERGPERRAFGYGQMRDMAVAAEQGGLDSIWVADHLFFDAGDGEPVRGVWESMAMLGALADATTRVELGPLVLCTPFRNPGMIAWAANTLEEISGGRFVLGLGSGWHKPEFDAFGFEFTRRVSVFADSLEVIIPLLRDRTVDYEGDFAVGRAELRPTAPRPGGPPIMIAGTKPRMMGLISRWADRWNDVWFGLPTDEFRDNRALLQDACQTIGRDPASIEVSAGIVIKDPRAAERDDAEQIVGQAEHIAEALAAWRDEGVDEVMCRMEPPSVEMVQEIAEATAKLRAA